MSKTGIQDTIKELNNGDLFLFACDLVETSRFAGCFKGGKEVIKDIWEITEKEMEKKGIKLPHPEITYHIAIDSIYTEKTMFNYLGIKNWKDLVENYN
ncbi:MAG: hypothetical protein KKE93_01845 [Nanoarchaeota archaeon]|nr:hypothetical protein [Nanoarchaeota archaeon]